MSAIDQAIHYATDQHAAQFRKGTNVPYILHPLETMNILMHMNADTNLLMAGVLHDTIEDTGATYEDIVQQFGRDVANLVKAHSEDKSKTWQERKSATIEELKYADRRLKMLVMADKVSNLRSIAADYLSCGDKLWTRFNAPKEKQSWYYSEIQDALWDMQNDPDTSAVYWEMVGLYKDVFVKYYKSYPIPGYYENYIVQISAHGIAFRLNKGCPQWYQVQIPNIEDEECDQISRFEAEKTEDEWNGTFPQVRSRDIKSDI